MELFDCNLHLRAIRAMIASDCEDQSEAGVSLAAICSGEQNFLSREEFLKIFESEKWNWIFDDKKIRERMRDYYMDEYVLQTMGY